MTRAAWVGTGLLAVVLVSEVTFMFVGAYRELRQERRRQHAQHKN